MRRFRRVRLQGPPNSPGANGASTTPTTPRHRAWTPARPNRPPRVNVTRPPGQWQSYDIIFLAPRFQGGRLPAPARVTMFHNGVLVHLDEPIRGETGHRLVPQFKQAMSTGPLVLAGHGCPVRFRNIWVRSL